MSYMLLELNIILDSDKGANRTLEQNKAVVNNNVKSINFVLKQRHKEIKFRFNLDLI